MVKVSKFFNEISRTPAWVRVGVRVGVRAHPFSYEKGEYTAAFFGRGVAVGSPSFLGGSDANAG